MKTLLFTHGKTMLKTIAKTSIHLPMAAMFLTAFLVGPAAAAEAGAFQRPVGCGCYHHADRRPVHLRAYKWHR